MSQLVIQNRFLLPLAMIWISTATITCSSGRIIRSEKVFTDSIETNTRPYRAGPGDEITLFFKPGEHSGEDEYRFEVGDIIEIRFYSNPELNAQPAILPDGEIILSPIGSISAEGLTPTTLAETLMVRFSSIITDPLIFVAPSHTFTATRELIASLALPQQKNIPLVVSPDGYLLLPFSDSLMVSGKTLADISSSVTAAYSKVTPHLTISSLLTKATNNMVHIIGAVRAPGSYPVSSASTLTRALALAQVDMNDARLKSVVLLSRTADNKPIEKVIDVRRILNRGDLSKDIILGQLDVIYVPEKPIVKADRFVRQYINELIPQIFRLGIGINWDLNAQYEN